MTGGQAGKNAVENNSLSGDKARESVKQAAESLKNQVRDKLGEGTTSSIANGIINALADTGDAALGGADYAADAAMALASCATGDSYCSTALNDLSGKNQAVADSVKALMNSDTWSAVADTIKQASEGNQAALEATGGLVAGIILPGRKCHMFLMLAPSEIWGSSLSRLVLVSWQKIVHRKLVRFIKEKQFIKLLVITIITVFRSTLSSYYN